MKKITVPAKVEQLDAVIEFVNEILESADCPIKVSMQIAIAVEEIFVNIAHYAYTPGQGDATISCCVEEAPKCAVIRFEDSGVPYDPLQKEDPDITLSAEERDIGGLGIYMVKKSMDAVEYEYANGQNIFTIKKFL